MAAIYCVAIYQCQNGQTSTIWRMSMVRQLSNSPRLHLSQTKSNSHSLHPHQSFTVCCRGVHCLQSETISHPFFQTIFLRIFSITSRVRFLFPHRFVRVIQFNLSPQNDEFIFLFVCRFHSLSLFFCRLARFRRRVHIYCGCQKSISTFDEPTIHYRKTKNKIAAAPRQR